MEIVFVIFIIGLIVFTFKGYTTTKDEERSYRDKIRNMTTKDIREEQYNINMQIKHVPNTVIRKNSSTGVYVRKVQIKNTIILEELRKRNSL